MKPHPLKVERELRGWSQAKVAEAVGTNVRTVIRWEQGQSVPYPYHRELLCAVFGKNARELGLLEETGAETPQAPQSVPRASEGPLFDPATPALINPAALIGRAGLLAQIKQRLWEGGNFALTALLGLPGMGKTSLAIALAADTSVRERFPDGILWAGLGQEPDVLGHFARWGKLLGIAPSEVEDVNSQQSWARALRAAIGQRRLLLVVDDAWCIEDALAFQVGGAQCAHLLTTRLPHVAFAFAREGTLTIPELSDDDGLVILARHVPQLVEQDPERARELVQAVGGLPLALTLMSNYLASQAFTGQARRLQAALTRLHDAEQRLRLSVPLAAGTHSPAQATAIPLSLHAAIAVSDQRLSALAHAALCDLAIFPPKPNSFSEEAALAVSAAPVETLDELWDAGLLESGGSERYTLHQTIADYARAQMRGTEASLRLLKYSSWYLQSYGQDYDALEQELPNILAALDLALSQKQLQSFLQSVNLLVPFMRVRGHFALAERLLQQMLQVSTDEGDMEGRVSALCYLAAFAELRSDYPLAEDYAQQGLHLTRQIEGLAHTQSILLRTLGQVALQRGAYARSQELCEEGLRLAREFGSDEDVCMLLLCLGRLRHYQGNYAQSLTVYTEGLAIARRIAHQELTCFALTYLGSAILEQGNYARAEELYQDGLVLARALGFRKQLSVLLNDLGVVASRRGDLSQATAHYLEGLELAQQIGLRADICLFLSNLGITAAKLEDYVPAERYLREGIELARQIDNRNHLCLLLSNLGSVLGYRGAYEQANACFEESLGLARSIGALWYISNVLTEWGGVHIKYQQLDAAFEAFQEVITSENLAETEPVMIGLAYYGLARVSALRGQHAEALRLGQQSLEQFEAIKHHKAREVADWLQKQQEQ
jgi:tetratricopeptide (TPR) repeat protein/transcriptional regulator with XRE-family HTH domain